MKVILTGAGGFIGSCFLWKLNALGIDDVILVDTDRDGKSYKNLARKKFTDYLTREDLLNRLEGGKLADRDLIVHLGACSDTTERDRAFLAFNNVEYSKRLAKWALRGRKAFHYASSASVYGGGENGYADTADLAALKALNPYAESKLTFDRWIVNERIAHQVVGFRYFNVFGPNEYHKGHMRSMVCKAYEQIKSTGRAQLFATTRPGQADGSEERDFIYVKDAVDVMAYFLSHPDETGIYNVGTGQARSFKDLVTAIFTATGRAPAIDYIPMPDALKGQYQYFTQADISRLKEAGYSKAFTSLEDAVKDYVQNYLMKPDPIL